MKKTYFDNKHCRKTYGEGFYIVKDNENYYLGHYHDDNNCCDRIKITKSDYYELLEVAKNRRKIIKNEKDR